MSRTQNRLAVAEVAEVPASEPTPESTIRRWVLGDLDQWFLARLNERWAGYTEAVWRGKLAGFAASNDYLFVRNDGAIWLGMMYRHAMTGSPAVLEVLGWARQTDRNGILLPEESHELLALYRHAVKWARSMKAIRIMFGTCTDLIPQNIAKAVNGDYMVDLLL